MKQSFKGNHLLNYFSFEELNKIKKIEDLYLKAELIIAVLFKDKVDKAGRPYIGHLYRVSDKLENPIEKVSGLLHDTFEDTIVTYDDLLEIGFPIEILDIVRLVTKDNIDKSNLSKIEKLKLYNEEINKIINSGNIMAIRLKEADMSDNYNPDRIKELSEDKQEWFKEKYDKQLIKLRRAKGEKNI